MSDDQDHGFETDALHVGQEEPDAEGARAPPLYQTTSYVFDDAADAAAQFALEKPGHIYSRLMNPTVGMLQERLAALEGGVGAVATASGMASLNLATFLLADVGDNVVTASSLYGGTYTYSPTPRRAAASRRGSSTRSTTTPTPRPSTRHGLRPLRDHRQPVAGHTGHRAPRRHRPRPRRLCAVDNTFATPYLCSPLDHGADIVWHSTTKWIHGPAPPSAAFSSTAAPSRGTSTPTTTPKSQATTRRTTASTSTSVRRRGFTYAAIARGLRDLGCRSRRSTRGRRCRARDAPAADARPLRQRDGRRRVPRGPPRSLVGHLPRPRRPRDPRHRRKYLDGGYGGMITFGLDAGYDAARTTVNRRNSPLSSPTSATRRRSSSTRPRPRTSNSPTTSRPPRASPPTWSGCLSASRRRRHHRDLDQAIGQATN